MIKFITTVSIVLSMAFPPAVIAAEENKSASSDIGTCVTRGMESSPYKKGSPEYSKERNKWLEVCRGATSGRSCATIGDEWNKTVGDFTKACRSANLSSSSSTHGAIACSDEFQKCLESQDTAVEDDEDEDGDSKGRCAGVSKEDMKEIKEGLKDVNDEIKDLNEQLNESQGKVAEETNNKQEQALAAQEEMANAQRECRDAQKEVRRNVESAAEEIQAKVDELNAQVNAMNAQIDAYTSQKEQEGVKYYQGLTEIENQCHAAGIEEAKAYRAVILTKVASSTHNVGDFNAALGKAGKTDIQRDQERAWKAYKRCVNDASTQRKREVLSRTHTANLASIDRSIEAQRAQINVAINQMGQLKYNKTATMQAQAQEDMNDLRADCAQRMGIAQQKVQMTSMAASGGGMMGMLGGLLGGNQQQPSAADQSVARAKQELEVAQGRKSDLMKQYSRMVGSGGETNATQKATAMDKYTELGNLAREVVGKCCQEGDPLDAQTCTMAKNYYAYIGGSEAAVASTTPTTPTTTTTESTPETPTSTTDTSATPDNTPTPTRRRHIPTPRNGPTPACRNGGTYPNCNPANMPRGLR